MELNEKRIFPTVGGTQIEQTKDSMTIIVPGSDLPTFNLPTVNGSNCEPPFGQDVALTNCDPHFGQDVALTNCDPHFGALVGVVDWSSTIDKRLIIDGDTSDGYHTFNELYEHRTALFATICRLLPERSWKSCFHADGTMFPGMFIAGIETPKGYYSYHCEMKYWAMFDQVPELTRAPEWDGHEPKDFTRLFSLEYNKVMRKQCSCGGLNLGKLAWNEGEEV